MNTNIARVVFYLVAAYLAVRMMGQVLVTMQGITQVLHTLPPLGMQPPLL